MNIESVDYNGIPIYTICGDIMFQDILNEKKISLYRISKDTKIPYSTLNDFYNNKSRVEDMRMKTVEKLAGYFGMTIDEFYIECRIGSKGDTV